MSVEREFAELVAFRQAPAVGKHKGTVKSVSGGTATVLLDGGESATICTTVTTTCHAGNRVVVEIDPVTRSASVVGNITDPSASSQTVRAVQDYAETAAGFVDAVSRMAEEVEKDRDEVIRDMVEAGVGVEQIKQYVGYSEEATKTIAERVEEVDQSAQQGLSDIADDVAAVDAAYKAADEAISASVRTASDSAARAEAEASAAHDSARSALSSAMGAEADLSWLENMVGVANWMAQHARETADTAPVDGKRYYEKQDNGSMRRVEPYSYSPATGDAPDPDAAYYELRDGVYVAVADPTAEGMFSYVPTADTAPVEGKQYYRQAYLYAATSDTAPVEGKTYYEAVVSYFPTSDSAPVDGKTYYTYDPDDDGYDAVESPDAGSMASYYERSVAYAPVESPTAEGMGGYLELVPSGYEAVESPVEADIASYYEREVLYYTRAELDPAANGWWELDEAVSDFIAAHVSLDATGMNVSFDGGMYLRLGSIDGVDSDRALYLIDPSVDDPRACIVGKYGERTQTGAFASTHIETSAERMSFLQPGYSVPLASDGKPDYEQLETGKQTFPGEVAFVDVRDGTFYMANAVVVTDLRFGDWQWRQRDNGNLTLKWTG